MLKVNKLKESLSRQEKTQASCNKVGSQAKRTHETESHLQPKFKENSNQIPLSDALETLDKLKQGERRTWSEKESLAAQSQEKTQPIRKKLKPRKLGELAAGRSAQIQRRQVYQMNKFLLDRSETKMIKF